MARHHGGTAQRTTRHRVDHRHSVGMRVKELPKGTRTVKVGGVTYYTYKGVYYRPYYEGNQVIYVVVEKPE